MPDSQAPEVLDLTLPDEAATARLGEDLAMVLKAGDVVALKGDLGMGKSTLARALIRALAGDPALEVPSPTYTLVQPYPSEPPVAHFDLYRLGDAAELDELGFAEAAEDGIVLCEWPERAPEVAARAGLTLALREEGSGRRALLTGTPEAVARVRRSLALRAFLDALPERACDRRRLFGDASARRYETVAFRGARAILMDSPARPNGPPIRNGLPYSRIAHSAEDIVPFLAIDKLLRSRGYSAPEIYAFDAGEGFALLEHLGSETVLDGEGHPIPGRYEAAALVLAKLHCGPPVDPVIDVAPGLRHTIQPFDRPALSIEVELLLDWYVPKRFGRETTPVERDTFLRVWNGLFDLLEQAETSLLLRDHHSPNVIWRGERQGADRIGLIDFQDAMIGPTAYDLASLAQDARVDVPAALEARLLTAYLAARREQDPAFDALAFQEAYAIMAAQRATKILGIFVRLEIRDGKPQYLRHLPRLKAYLRRTLGHPALGALQILYDDWRLLDDAA